jgi:hypothetical protein
MSHLTLQGIAFSTMLEGFFPSLNESQKLDHLQHVGQHESSGSTPDPCRSFHFPTPAGIALAFSTSTDDISCKTQKKTECV